MTPNRPIPCIACKNLSKRVIVHQQPLCILEDLSFSVDTGRSLAIVGRSGAGKSTLLGLLAGLDRPTQGYIGFQGSDINKLTEWELSAWRGTHLGFVFQEPQLLSQLNALENVILPLELKQDPQATRRAKTCLEQVGLLDRQFHYPSQLSGGEQQRVAIARAFVNEPTLLFMDEPTAHLDPQTALELMDLIFSLRTQQAFLPTLLCVTHDVAVQSRCDQILYLEAGRMIL